jgi:hypothetical protein
MAPPYSNHLLLQREAQQQLRDTIESIWNIVRASRQTMDDAREAIARADTVLARRLSEGSKDFLGAPDRNHRGQLKH